MLPDENEVSYRKKPILNRKIFFEMELTQDNSNKWKFHFH